LTYQRTQSKLLEGSRRTVAAYNAQAAASRALVLRAQMELGTFKQRMPALQLTLQQHDSKCDKQIQVLHEELAMVEGDIRTMLEVMNMSSCDNGNKPVLLQCHRKHTGLSFITFGHELLRARASMLNSAFSRQTLQSALQDVYSQNEEPATDEPTQPDAHAVMHALTQPRLRKKMQEKCTTSRSPNCLTMRDRFWQVLTGILDKEDDMKAELSNGRRGCEELHRNLQSQISTMESRDKDSATNLATATQLQNEAEEQSRLKDAEVRAMKDDYTKTMHDTMTNIRTYQHEICGLKKIRAELYLEKGKEVFIQDCYVSDWQAGDCSVSCGGGVQQMTRTVVAQPDPDGASCPPLVVEQQCAQEDCPVDCEVGDWQGWSTCTAACGGGVRQRAREVTVEPLNRGQPCGGTTQAESCNIQACDSDCTLSDWGPWSACSKMCSGGLLERRKSVMEEAVGSGACADRNSQERLEYKPCNQQACALSPGATTLQCHSKLDVTLLLDGGGRLGEAAWDNAKQGVASLVQALHGGEDGVLLSALAFGGPDSWNQFLLCTQGPKPGQAAPDLANDCGIHWVVRTTTDMESAAAKIKEVKWPSTTKFTSGALAAAEADIGFGRRDTESVVVVITDGRPMSPSRTRMTSGRLRKKARLMWVPVTSLAPLDDIRQWASHPVQENVIRVPSYDALKEPATISMLIGSICPRVE